MTDAIMSGLPPHIAQVICGHKTSTHDRLQGRLPCRGDRGSPGVHRPPPGHPAQRRIPYSDRRRMGRFLAHFEKRKVSVGTCARAFASPCVHEHACLTEMILKGPPGLLK